MIAFDLQCSNGHTFEGWFDNKEAFEEQRLEGLVECPTCSDKSVVIVPSTFSIPSAARQTAEPSKKSPKKQLAVGDISQKIAEFVQTSFDDVGSNFAKEALKIHYGVSEPRNIRGVSSPEQEKVLEQEGVPLFKVPMPEKPKSYDA